MPTFAQIQEEISAMLSIPDEDLTEEQRVAMDAYLDELAGQEADKVDAFGQFLRLEQARIESARHEANRLAKKAKTAAERIAWLKHKYLCIMQSAGLKKVQGSVYTVSLREAECVDVTDLSALPELYLRRKELVEPDKACLRETLKAGIAVPGATLVKTQSLQVR